MGGSYPARAPIWNPCSSRRSFRLVMVSIALLFVFGTLHLYQEINQRIYKELQTLDSNFNLGITHLPPLYETYHEYERNLPQHDPSLPAPEGKHAKFLNTANHAALSGWGNVIQELIMNAQLAYDTNRAWVFDNYTWDRKAGEYSKFQHNVVPSRIPLSALLAGPLVGGPWEGGLEKKIPRAVTPHYFHKVCSKKETVVLDSKELEAELVGKNGVDLMKGYVDKIKEIDARCLEIGGEVQVFDGWLFGSKNVQSLWPEMSKSPVLKQFGFSPLIIGAYLTNRLHFIPPSFAADPRTHSTSLSELIPGLMVLHLRRGDYEQHCFHLATYESVYMGWNSFPEFPDQLEEMGNLPGEIDDPKWRYDNVYQKHCFPSIDQIVGRVNDIRVAHHARVKGKGGKLTQLYIMSNGKKEWLHELKAALRVSATEKWGGISTSRDLILTEEQKYVSQQVDMYVGTRATVFVGVGFSSLTSGVVTLRKFNGLDPLNTRFW